MISLLWGKQPLDYEELSHRKSFLLKSLCEQKCEILSSNFGHFCCPYKVKFFKAIGVQTSTIVCGEWFHPVPKSRVEHGSALHALLYGTSSLAWQTRAASPSLPWEASAWTTDFYNWFQWKKAYSLALVEIEVFGVPKVSNVLRAIKKWKPSDIKSWLGIQFFFNIPSYLKIHSVKNDKKHLCLQYV